MKYEYKVVTIDINPGFAKPKINDANISMRLNELGKDGWELVSAATNNGAGGNSTSHTLYLKRPLEEE